MKFDKKEHWRHQAEKNRTSESDVPAKFKIINILRDQFGLHGLTGEALPIPGTGWARFPDVFIKSYNPQVAILLHGQGPHGVGDIISQTQRDQEARQDYARLPEIKLIEIYSAKTNGYETEAVIWQLIESGLIPVERAST